MSRHSLLVILAVLAILGASELLAQPAAALGASAPSAEPVGKEPGWIAWLTKGDIGPFLTQHSKSLGIPAALAFGLALLALWHLPKLLWKWCASYWADALKELTDDKVKLSDGLLERLRVAEARGRFSGALETAHRWLTRWYGQKNWGKASFGRALLVALLYPLLFLVVVWLMGGEGRLGSALVLSGDLPVWRRWVLLLLILTLSGIGWAYANDKLQARLRQTSGRKLPDTAAQVVLFLIFAGAIVVAVAGAVYSVVAVAFAFAVAVAISGSGAFAFAFPVAISSAFAVAGAFAVAAAGAVAGAGAGAGAFALAVVLMVDHADRRASNAKGGVQAMLWRLCGQWLPQWMVLVAAAAAPVWLPQWVAIREAAFSAKGPSFVFLFFLGLMPWWNAVCDYLSVGLTRVILGSYRAQMDAGHAASQPKWLAWLLLDLALALALTALLLLGTFAIVAALQSLGWGVDARALLSNFEQSPWWGSASVWLISMALTNVLPTLLHMGLVLVAAVSQRWSRQQDKLPLWLTTLEAGKKLPPLDARALLDFLWVWRVMWLLLSAVLLLGLYFAVAYLMTHALPAMAWPVVKAILAL